MIHNEGEFFGSYPKPDTLNTRFFTDPKTVNTANANLKQF